MVSSVSEGNSEQGLFTGAEALTRRRPEAQRIFVDASWDRFLDGFWWNFAPKRSQVGTKMGSKIDVNFEGRFLIIRALPAAGAGKIKIWGSKLGATIDQKSIQK